MTRTTRFMLAAGVAALGATLLAGASVAGDRGRHHGHGHHDGTRLFETFDANSDGRLTQAEVDEVRQGQLEAFDADGDGQLNLEEYQALWMDAMRERMVDRFQSHDDDGDGLVTAEEFGERFERIVDRLDQDGDGEVTEEELRQRHRGRERGGDDDRSG